MAGCGFVGSAWSTRMLVGTLALGIALAAQAERDEKGASGMDARDQLSARMQALPDEVYLRRDGKAVAALPREALALRFSGLLLGAPRVVDLAPSRGVPALLLTARSKARSAEVDWHRNAVVVASDVDRGEGFAAEAFQPDPTKSPGPPPRSDGRRPAQPPASQPDPTRASTAGTVWLDFGKLLKLPAQHRRWAFRVIYFDQISNPAFVELQAKSAGPAAMSEDEAVKLVARMRAAGQRDGLPRYYRTAETPQLLAAGVSARLGDTVNRAHLSMPLHGVMNVELTDHVLVKPAGAGGAAQPSPQTKPPAAVVRAMVLVLMKDKSPPTRIALEIPVWSDRPLKPGDIAEAAFSLDLADSMPKDPSPGTYQVYVISGRHASGPHALSIGK